MFFNAHKKHLYFDLPTPGIEHDFVYCFHRHYLCFKIKKSEKNCSVCKFEDLMSSSLFKFVKFLNKNKRAPFNITIKFVYLV